MAPTRGLTEIEHNVIDGVVKLVLEHLTETWRNIVDVRFRVNGRDTRPQMLQVAAPNEVVVLIGFDIKIGDARGMLNFCLPATAIETVGDSFTHTLVPLAPRADARRSPPVLAHARAPAGGRRGHGRDDAAGARRARTRAGRRDRPRSSPVGSAAGAGLRHRQVRRLSDAGARPRRRAPAAASGQSPRLPEVVHG